MKLRSRWYFGIWLAAGLIGFVLLFPERITVRLPRIWQRDGMAFDRVATAMPDGEMDSSFIEVGAGPAGTAAPIVLPEQSPSDHGNGYSATLEDTADAAWGTDWGADDAIDDALGGNSGGLGFTGTGIGGGGASTGRIRMSTERVSNGGYGAPKMAEPPPPRVDSPMDQAPAAASADYAAASEAYAAASAAYAAASAAYAAEEAIPDLEELATGFANEAAGLSFGSGTGAQYTTRSAAPAVNPSESPTAPASAGSEYDTILDEIDRKLAGLPLGNIAFNAPETIPFGDCANIELLVSLSEAEEVLREAVRGPGPIETAQVHVSPYMEAQLSGVGFAIESGTPARQLLSRSERTRWRWQIEPTKADSLELTLTLSALFTVDGVERTRTIQTFEKTIVVDVPMRHRVAQFLGSNREWLATALAIPLVGALYRRFRKPRGKPSSTTEEPQRRAA